MTCDERQDLLLLYAADALDEGERTELRAHLASGCPRCAGALAEAQATVGHLPLALDEQMPPSGARDQLMQRVLADASSPRAGEHRYPSAKPASGGRGLWITLGAAAAVVLVVIGVTMRSITNNYQQRLASAEELRRDAESSRQVLQQELLQFRAENDQLRRVGALIGSSNLDLVKLASDQSPARGRIFWDHDHGKWHVQVFDLKPPPAGREFELWFITPDQRKIPAGTFRVDASGKGTHEVAVPKDIGPIQLAAITDEPIGGVEQPTGSIHLEGAVQ